jgi:aryl-alcohol dehydrogenase-like predicted oxidoreductase
MKILLQHTRTLLYVRSNETWTRSEFEARDFQHSQRAIDFAHEHNLQEVQIAVKFVDAHYDVVAPVPPAPRAAAISAPIAA